MTSFMQKMTKVMQDGFDRQLLILKQELKELRKEVEEERNMRLELQRENARMKEELVCLNDDLTFLHSKVDEMEQQEKNLDIVIDNVDEATLRGKQTPFEDLVNSTLMGKVIETSEVLRFRTFQTRRTGKVSILATVRNEAVKKAIFSQKKMFVKKGMYVKENLTSHRYNLLLDTKKFAKENDYKYVWTRNGQILMRKSEEDRVILIKNRASLRI